MKETISGINLTPDRRALHSEIIEIVTQEETRLEEYINYLSLQLKESSISPLDINLMKDNLEDLEYAKAALHKLLYFVSNPKKSDYDIFNNIIKIAGYTFKKSIASRTSFLRHTPTLRGLPIALDPRQNHLLKKVLHTVDYARGGYILFQEPMFHFKDHPELKTVASEMAQKLYGNVTNIKSIIFTCGLAAINTFNDYLRALSAKSGRMNYIGQNCWIELKKQITEVDDPSFVFFNETDLGMILKLLSDKDVQSINLEGIQNYPTLHVTDLKYLCSKIKEIDFCKPKYLVIDNVVTFDVNLFRKYFPNGMPKNFCLISFISGIKFTQAGWDISKSGFLFFKYDKNNFEEDVDPYTKIIEIRAGSGRVPSLEEAYLSIIETSNSIKSRMRRYDRNTGYLAQLFASKFEQNGLGSVHSAWLLNHPGHETALENYGTGGRFMYLTFNEKYLPEEKLMRLYRYLADNASKDGISIMAASNFGFSSPHIHMVRHNLFGLSLRISPGSTDLATTHLVGNYIIKKVEEFIDYNDDAISSL